MRAMRACMVCHASVHPSLFGTGLPTVSGSGMLKDFGVDGGLENKERNAGRAGVGIGGNGGGNGGATSVVASPIYIAL
jgi:hypothetical protein